jgi:hypothetical protein
MSKLSRGRSDAMVSCDHLLAYAITYAAGDTTLGPFQNVGRGLKYPTTLGRRRPRSAIIQHQYAGIQPRF